MSDNSKAIIWLLGCAVLTSMSVIGLNVFIFKPEWRDDTNQADAIDLAKTIERIRGCEECEVHLFVWMQDDSIISRRENWAANANHNWHLIDEMGKKYPKVYEEYK